MTEARFRRAAELFLRARGLGVRERDELLERECSDNAPLRAEIDRLLAGAEQDLPFADLAARLVGEATVLSTSVDTADSRVGAYRLLEKIGEGGFGVVYMAEQTEPVRRKVAVKVLRAGMDTQQVIARFEAERQALAMMEHANITRVLDAGSTANGRPYFVMELVRGVPITTYCDTHRLGTRQRIELMLPVCHAVHHAHQKGIIHRDLKPSNVLVTLHDGLPVPKVIDFGIAKALSGRLTDRTLFTEYRQLLGTPEYMSPEQAEMSGLDIDTRADIYSLGVMLYELLTGTTPHDATTLRSVSQSEVQRIIREVEPLPPSRRLTAAPRTPADTSELADKRGTLPAALHRELAGELDWIAMKCLEKDRTRRYETANDLLLDLTRYLRHEPVLASPPSTWYRLRKTARRHRGLLGAVAATMAALVIGLVVALYFMVEAREQRDVASAEMDRARRTAEVLNQLLLTAGPEQRRGASYTVAAMLDDFSAKLGERLTGAPGIEVPIRILIGGAFVGVADFAQARAHLERAVTLARGIADTDNGRRLEAQADEALARLLLDLGQYGEGAQRLRHALQMRRDLPQDLRQRASIAASLGDLAQAQLHDGHWQDALASAREAVAIADGVDTQGGEVSDAARTLGEVLIAIGDYRAAEPIVRRAIDLHRRQRENVRLVSDLADLAACQIQLGRREDAEALVREALALRAEWRGGTPQSAIGALHNLSIALTLLGHRDEAEDLYRETLRRELEVLGPDHISVARTEMNLATLLHKRGETDEAQQRYERAIAVIQARSEGDRLEVADAMGNLAALRASRNGPGDLDAAAPLFEQSLAIRRRLLGDKDPRVASGYDNIAKLEDMRGNREAALTALRRAVEVARAGPGDDAPLTKELVAELRELEGDKD